MNRTEANETQKAPIVFISYSHDSPAHSHRVLAFAVALRDHGVDVELDQFYTDEIVDWPRWCNERTSLAHSDFVLCACTEEYRRRIEGNVPPARGKGVYWEGSLLDDDVYDAKGNRRLIVVLFDDEPEASIPRFLRGWTFCRVREFSLTDSGYEHTLRIITGQARVAKNPLGTVPILPAHMLPTNSPRTDGNEIFPSRLRHGDDRYFGDQKEVATNPLERPTVIGIEFVADGPLSEFDQARWEAALRELLGQDVSKVRIACIRKGSTIVRLLGDPEVIARAVEKLGLSRQALETFQANTGSRIYSGLLNSHAARQIFGRSEELARLDQAWDEQRVRVLCITGLGGVGKSYLISHWMARLAADGWRGAERVFDWSFYSQGIREQGTAAADMFIAAALVFFGDAALASESASPWDKGSRLAQLIAQQRTLLVLDGLEPLQHPPGPLRGQLKDPALAALLKGLAQHSSGLCLVTSREPLADLTLFYTTAPEWELDNLSTPAGVELLRTLGVHGPEAQMQRLVEDVAGHALTLNLLGRYLTTAHQGDIRRRDQVEFENSDVRTRGGDVSGALAAYEKLLTAGGEADVRALAVLRLLGLFDRPADSGCLEALRHEPVIGGLTEPLVGLNEKEWSRALSSLADYGLVSLKTGQSALDAHPLIRDYFARQIRSQNPTGWQFAHRRLYEHLRDSAEPQPATLEGLQPLYQAVAHGCRAELMQEAFDLYFERILRGNGSYSWRALGSFGSDLGAIACFFEQPWNRISRRLTASTQAFLLSCAALCLRALGRLAEALIPMRAGLDMCVEQDDWKSGAVSASNLSALELTAGDVLSAVRDAELALVLASRIADRLLPNALRTTLADAMHQAGRRAEALHLFREVEIFQAEQQREYPLLYLQWTFHYCELLLADAERLAWQLCLRSESATASREPPQSQRGANPVLAEVVQRCREVRQRVLQTRKWTQRRASLLDLALDELTLGRAALYQALVEHASMGQVREQLSAAVDGLRRAGQQDHVPPGLLSRAWLRSFEGDVSGALADLDEASQIAERGPMRLHTADIHLHRARLFRDRQFLREARKLIDECSYHRRDEELADAEEAAKNW